MSTLAYRYVSCAILGAAFLAMYGALRSPDFMAVDGAVRCFEVYHRNEIFFHANNHMLYPVNVWGWSQLMRPVLGASQDIVDFGRRTQLMNGLAAAVAVSVLFALMHAATGSLGISLGTAVGYGLSRAMLLHATNSAEPPVGLALSFLAVAAAAAARRGPGRSWLTLAAGLLLAAAMATYQTMILAGPAVFCLCAAPDHQGSSAKVLELRIPALRLLGLTTGGGMGLLLIYGSCYAAQGISGIPAQLHRFFTVDGGTGVYGGLSASKLINTPIGLLGNVFCAYPAGYQGLRWLLRHHPADGWLPWLIVLGASNAVFVLALAVLLWRGRGGLSPAQRLATGAALVGLVFTIVGPAYWSATYDKFWLQPIAALVAAIGLGLAALPRSTSRQLLAVGCLVLLALEIVPNGIWAIRLAGRETECLREARQVEEIVGPSDLVVYEWDKLSNLHCNLYGFGRPIYCLPFAAHERGARVMDDLREQLRKTEGRGARAYFLGVMDVTEESWNSFLGRRLGVPYAALDPYRKACRPVAKFEIAGKPVTLQLYEPPASCKNE